MKIKLQSVKRVVNSILRPHFLEQITKSYHQESYYKGFELSLSALNAVGADVRIKARRQK